MIIAIDEIEFVVSVSSDGTVKIPVFMRSAQTGQIQSESVMKHYWAMYKARNFQSRFSQ